MIKTILKILKILGLFAFFWFLNNGLVLQPVWQPIQAGLFTFVTVIMFKYIKIKLKYWFYIIGLFYVASAVFEVLKILVFPEIMASTGFGILVILIIFRVLIRGDQRI